MHSYSQQYTFDTSNKHGSVLAGSFLVLLWLPFKLWSEVDRPRNVSVTALKFNCICIHSNIHSISINYQLKSLWIDSMMPMFCLLQNIVNVKTSNSAPRLCGSALAVCYHSQVGAILCRSTHLCTFFLSISSPDCTVHAAHVLLAG